MLGTWNNPLYNLPHFGDTMAYVLAAAFVVIALILLVRRNFRLAGLSILAAAVMGAVAWDMYRVSRIEPTYAILYPSKADFEMGTNGRSETIWAQPNQLTALLSGLFVLVFIVLVVVAVKALISSPKKSSRLVMLGTVTIGLIVSIAVAAQMIGNSFDVGSPAWDFFLKVEEYSWDVLFFGLCAYLLLVIGVFAVWELRRSRQIKATKTASAGDRFGIDTKEDAAIR